MHDVEFYLDHVQQMDYLQHLLNGIVLAVIMAGVIFAAMQYVLHALAYRRLIQYESVPKGKILGWIPIVQIYCLGKSADQIQARNGRKSSYGITMLILNSVLSILNIIGTILFIQPFYKIMTHFKDLLLYSYLDQGESYLSKLLEDSLSPFILGSILLVVSLGLVIWLIVLTGLSWNQIFHQYANSRRTLFVTLSILATVFLGFPALGSIFILVNIKNNRKEKVNHSL